MAESTNSFFGNALDEITDASGGLKNFFFGEAEPDTEDYDANFVLTDDGIYTDTNSGNIVDTRNVLQRIGDGTADATSNVWKAITTGEGRRNTFLEEEFGITQDPNNGILDPAAFDAEAARQGLVPNTVDGAVDPAALLADNNTAAIAGIDTNELLADTYGLENLELGEDGNFRVLGSALAANTEINNFPTPDDWRVRLHLGPQSPNILYKHNDPGILYPLKNTDGIIFPYTPIINIQYQADYESYDLTHSNYRGYFYRGSSVQNLVVTATFTAQDTEEANYMLAALHFLRSCTKMFYGQDEQRGTPPPLVFLTGYGEYQFNHHPCVITTMAYNLPNDVDYIAAGVPQPVQPQNFRQESGQSQAYQSPLKRLTNMFGGASESRLDAAGLNFGAKAGPTAGSLQTETSQDLQQLTKIYENKTYVPTKMDINFTMLPINTREQVSSGFSLKDYANGKLLKNGKGYW